MRSIYLKSGLGEETYAPPFIFQGYNEAALATALQEAKEGMFSVVDILLSTSKIDPTNDIHIVVVTNGMGCGSGILAIDMASHILRRAGQKVQNALILITENISLNWYFGYDRSMLVTNCIFRVGCAAAIVTNDPNRRRDAKFQLLHSLRTHHGSDNRSYKAAFQEEDEVGYTGVSLTKDLIRVAGQNLRTHITKLAPRVLPLSQLVMYLKSLVLSVLTHGESKPMIPDFTTAFEHICIHTGGKAVIEEVGKVLMLNDSVTEPARMTLHRFGNTSSSLVFYELAYFEAQKRIKRGDRVWMLAFGTGFKIGSLVWKALNDANSECVQTNP